MPPKRRRRFHGLYYHSSPPKVMPMNQNGRKRRDNDDFSVKLSTIRIWMHEKEIGKLTRILWAGQGHRLCQQASNNGRVKRFLAAVPHVMNAIKDLHQAVIDNNLETLQVQLEPPVPAALVTCKDGNGLNVIHKAAGLGHTKILEYLIGIWPEGAHEIDITGKTPLHWAASAKNNMRCYTLLTQAGCDEEALDYKMKTPSYYRHKPHEIERAFLVYVPEAPRVSPDSVTDWEALNDGENGGAGAGGDHSTSQEIGKKAISKIASTQQNGRKSLDDSLENTSELDTIEGLSANDELEDDDLSKVEENGQENGHGNDNGDAIKRRPETPATFDQNGQESEESEDVENVARDVSQTTEENGNEKEEVEAADQKQQDEDQLEIQPEEEQKEEKQEDEQDLNEKTDDNEEEAKNEESEIDDRQNNGDDDKVNDEVAVPAENEDDNALAEPPAETVDDNDDDDEDVITTAKQNGKLEETEPQIEPQVEQQVQEPNQEDAKEPEDDGNESLTSSLAIEGFVQGASEDFTVQSQTAAYQVDDEDLPMQQIVEAGDLEQLAEIVLNGEGSRLLGQKSKDPDIQAFLNNVPSYMEKIHRVHDAARDGSLLALQQALDRRKFAIAKDDISPNGSTPLHVAVLFGHTDIVRYLASRFPETMAVTDNDGRTPLHYAATIKDNGHFYNMLIQLGANPKELDKLGHTAEFYLDMDKSKDILTYTELLNVFGAEELENQLLSDQGPKSSQPMSNLQANPIFKTEQGKYLADSLAEPLIKALTEIAQKRPKDPVAYLSGYLQQIVGERKPITEVQVHSGSNNSSTSTAKLANSTRSNSNNSRAAFTSNNNANTDIIELDDESSEQQEAEDTLTSQHMEERDEHGQSMLHFACARSHRRGQLFTLIEESRIDITYRDELYRTARDVALQANQPNNAAEIDRYVVAQAIIGNVETFEQLALQGYDHILDLEDDRGKSIVDVALSRHNDDLVTFLGKLRTLEETREELHQMIRDNNMEKVKELTSVTNAKWFIKTKNYYGRTALHIAVLKESEEMVQHLVKLCPEALKITDNLERTVLHYAMGTNSLESVSRILIQNGAKRTAKDLKGRQPSYYFINKADILRLQEEEEESR